MSFSGFNEDTMKFLLENKLNNSKDWYESHKSLYKQYVYNPFVELVTELAPTMTQIDSQLIITPSKLISRVRRDTRFTKDKSLYRDNVWLVFLRDKSQMSSAPCYWFEISQRGSIYGVGHYSASTGSMAIMREMILKSHPAFLSALRCYESQKTFTLGGELYKRSKYPNQPESLRSWLDRKNIYFECVQDDFNLVFSKELPDVLKKGFKELKPVYEFLCILESYN